MTERIKDPAQAPAVLVGHLRSRGGAGPDRPREHRVWIINQQQGPARRAADRPRAEPRAVRSARGNPESRVPDHQLRDDLIAFAYLVLDPRAESRLVERDGRSGAIDPQLRLDARHAGERSRTHQRRCYREVTGRWAGYGPAMDSAREELAGGMARWRSIRPGQKGAGGGTGADNPTRSVS